MNNEEGSIIGPHIDTSNNLSPVSRLLSHLDAFDFFRGTNSQTIPSDFYKIKLGNLWNKRFFKEWLRDYYAYRGNIHFRYSQCFSHVNEENSNYRNLRNFVDAMKNSYSQGYLQNCE